MKLNNKVALALTLAFASVGAHAQDKGLDIGLGSARPAAAPAQPPAPGVNLQALAAAKAQPAAKPQMAATVRAQPVAAPVAQPAARPAPAAVARPVAASVAPPSTPVAAPQQAAAAPAIPAQPALAPSGPALAQQVASSSPSVNPFTGRDITAEQRQRQLEEAKMDTDIIQERLRQANLMADLAYLPLKKKAEVSTLPGMSVAAVSPTAKQAAATGPDAPAEPRKPVAKKKVAKKKELPAAPAAPVIPPAPTITVSGISINGNQSSAILEVDGGVMSVPSGSNTQFGQLRVIDSRTISLGGKTYAVRDAMLSRMMVSDPTVTAADKVRAPIPAPAPAVAAAQQAVANIPLPPLPPLPAPRGPAPTPGR